MDKWLLFDSLGENKRKKKYCHIPSLSPNTISSIPSGAKTQKIKRIDHRNCNVRASKNAEQAFSTQWYLYICYGLLFLFSVFWLQKEWMQYVFWGDKGERSRVYYLLSPPCWTFFQVSLMIRWYCKLSLYMIHLSLYCRNISFLSMRVIRCMLHIS